MHGTDIGLCFSATLQRTLRIFMPTNKREPSVMDIGLYFNFKGTTPPQWADAWEETVILLEQFPLPLMRIVHQEKYGAKRAIGRLGNDGKARDQRFRQRNRWCSLQPVSYRRRHCTGGQIPSPLFFIRRNPLPTSRKNGGLGGRCAQPSLRNTHSVWW